MSQIILLISIGLAIFLFERFFILSLLKTEKGKNFIRSKFWLQPNFICWCRLPMGFASYLIWQAGFPAVSVIFCAFWMLTDMTDGTIARGCNLGTKIGEWLDPLSDKFMYIPMLFLFTQINLPEVEKYQILDLFPFILFSIIDILGQISRFWVKKKAANSFGKAKMVMVCVLLIILSMQFISFEAFRSIPFLGQVNVNLLLWSCLTLAFLSFYCKIIPDIWYANSLTLLNFICGLAAIFVTVNNFKITQAFILIFLGQFFDLLDGRTARKFGSTRHGALFDDIADGTSFGIAIATIIFLSLKPFNLYYASFIAIFYASCVIYRLYYFIKNKHLNPVGIFSGFPSPAGAMLAGSATLLFNENYYLIGGITFLSSILMISKIKYKHFGQRIWGSIPNAVKISVFAFILFAINIIFKYKTQEKSLIFFSLVFFFIILYAIAGVDYKLIFDKSTKE